MTDTAETKLYECEVDGATYWVAAFNPFHAVELLKTDVIASNGDCLADVDIVTVEECVQSRAERARFRTDDGEHRSMWGEFLRGRAPRVVACSEY